MNNFPFQVDAEEDKDKVEKFKGFLMQLNIRHVAAIYGLYDIYNVLAKAQHGVCKINQLPWEYDERIQKLKGELRCIIDGTHSGFLSKHKQKLLNGLLHDDFPIVTEMRRVTRRATLEVLKPNEKLFEEGRLIATKFAARIIKNLDERIENDSVCELITESFREWNKESLINLITLANSSGRNYGDQDKLLDQYEILKIRYDEVRATDDLQKWTMFFRKKNLYADIPEILHLALCCFMKIPLEATAETIGSVINNHGSKSRTSLLPKTLSNEVQVAWNGPGEFSPLATSLIKDSLDTYFQHTQPGMRFFARTRLKIMSSTVAEYMKRPSRILFSV